ncbi:MAG: 3-dehydroquinate synthase [Acidobacteriota bacterium]|nr:3-dehydroquinate synthase [Acidobacteriota bacterium]
MTSFLVSTPQGNYEAVVQRGLIERVGDYIPKAAGKIFVVTTGDVWKHQGSRLRRGLVDVGYETLYLPGGEEQKRLAPAETLAGEMIERGADRSSLIVAFGGGIVNDMAGFVAAIFMRGIPVLQIPTTLLAQVDAAIGGKTGVNLTGGKNLIGSFHQPIAVLIDPAALDSLPEREYRAGLYEVIKYGVIASVPLFRLLADHRDYVLERRPETVDEIIRESVRIKAEVVSADERESGIRRILNFGHTIGHALEAETAYSRFLHGEAIAFGMKAATLLARNTGSLSSDDCSECINVIDSYGPIPSLAGIPAEALHARLVNDKKTIKGKVHFILPTEIGKVTVVSDVPEQAVRQAIQQAIQQAVP